MKYDQKKRVFLVKKQLELGNITLVKRAWRTNFKNLKAPSTNTINSMVAKFEKMGLATTGRPETSKKKGLRGEAKKVLEKVFIQNPSYSIRKAASTSGFSYSLCQKVVKYDLKLKPYKRSYVHKLNGPDYSKRLDFAKWFLGLPSKASQYLICTDEAFFTLVEPLNRQNNRIWAHEKPDSNVEKPLFDQKLLVWMAISAKKVYGFHIFTGNVNQFNYLEMLQNFFWPKHLRTADYKKYYFQQDGAKPHTADSVQIWLREKFGSKFIAKEKWPPRSPDLNPCDFFLWGYLKSKVYNPIPKNLDDLKSNLEREVKKINSNMLESVFLNFKKRCELVISAQGGHFEDK